MNEQTLQIILGLIAIVPTMTTIVVSVFQNSQRRRDKEEQRRRDERNAAKSSIQNMITQDIIRVELLGKMPENRDNIESEYTRYHQNGGNGTITRQVREYFDWLDGLAPRKLNVVKNTTV